MSKVYELIGSEDKWCKEAYAIDENNIRIRSYKMLFFLRSWNRVIVFRVRHSVYRTPILQSGTMNMIGNLCITR